LIAPLPATTSVRQRREWWPTAGTCAAGGRAGPKIARSLSASIDEPVEGTGSDARPIPGFQSVNHPACAWAACLGKVLTW